MHCYPCMREVKTFNYYRQQPIMAQTFKKCELMNTFKIRFRKYKIACTLIKTILLYLYFEDLPFEFVVMYSTISCSAILYPTIDLKIRKKRKEVSVE